MYGNGLIEVIAAILAIIMIITFFHIADRLKKIFFILDYYYQKDKKSEQK